MLQQQASPARPAAAGEWVVVERSPTARRLLRDTVANHRLIWWFGSRLLVRTYAATRLGMPWLFVRPILPLLGMAFLFGGIFGAASSGVPYLLFLLVGTMAWRSFERIIFWATRGLDRYGKFWSNFDFPMLTVPIGVGSMAAFELVVYTVLAGLVIAWFAIADGTMYLNLGPELLVGVAGIALAAVFGLGIGLVLALLNAKARDTFMVLRYGLQVWVVLTPVYYPVESLPSGLGFLATVNPVAPMVQMTKWGLIDAAELDVVGVVWACVATALAFGGGLYLFARRAPWIWRDDLRYDESKEDEELFAR